MEDPHRQTSPHGAFRARAAQEAAQEGLDSEGEGDGGNGWEDGAGHAAARGGAGGAAARAGREPAGALRRRRRLPAGAARRARPAARRAHPALRLCPAQGTQAEPTRPPAPPALPPPLSPEQGERACGGDRSGSAAGASSIIRVLRSVLKSGSIDVSQSASQRDRVRSCLDGGGGKLRGGRNGESASLTAQVRAKSTFQQTEDWTAQGAASRASRHYITGDYEELLELANYILAVCPRLRNMLLAPLETEDTSGTEGMVNALSAGSDLAPTAAPPFARRDLYYEV
eukprot:1192237-Prorocentrum_minimum.AAC.2